RPPTLSAAGATVRRPASPKYRPSAALARGSALSGWLMFRMFRSELPLTNSPRIPTTRYTAPIRVLTARALASVREEASQRAPTATWMMLGSGFTPNSRGVAAGGAGEGGDPGEGEG